MNIRFRGAVTFDEDETLEVALQSVYAALDAAPQPLLKREHVEPLGLHVTVRYDGDGTTKQYQTAEQILRDLVAQAYSGYVDATVDEAEPTRLHAKEINPIEVDVVDLIED